MDSVETKEAIYNVADATYILVKKKRSWPLNRCSSEIRIRPFKKVTLFQYKIA